MLDTIYCINKWQNKMLTQMEKYNVLYPKNYIASHIICCNWVEELHFSWKYVVFENIKN